MIIEYLSNFFFIFRFQEVDKAGCDIIMKRRIRRRNTLPGALWHIFHPTDTVKIRDFLNKVALEKGMRLDPHDDPIHDQSTYLDAKLRRRLYQEYGVRGMFLQPFFNQKGRDGVCNFILSNYICFVKVFSRCLFKCIEYLENRGST